MDCANSLKHDIIQYNELNTIMSMGEQMMERRFSKFRYIGIFILGLFLSIIIGIKNRDIIYASDNKSVLFISSYSQSFPTVPEQLEGIYSVFTPNNIDIDIEYMDTKRFMDEEWKKLFYISLQHKLDRVEPYNGIIVGDDNALDFVMEFQEDLFPDTPIVFFCVNSFSLALEAAENNYITGIIEESSLKENIELALKINSNTKKIIGIVDNTLTGSGDKAQFYYQSQFFPEILFEDINSSEHSIDEMKEILLDIEEDSILFYFSMFEDKYGNVMTIKEAVEIIADHTNVPVYRTGYSGGIGQGLFGGKVVAYKESGALAAEILYKIIAGTPIEQFEIITRSPNQYVFDYKLIKKFNISKSLIPKESIFINKELRFYEVYPTLTINALAVMIIIIIIIIILGFDNIKRRRMEKTLQENQDELSSLFEEVAATEEELRYQYEKIREKSDENEMLNQKYEIAINCTDSAVWEYNVLDACLSISENFRNILSQEFEEKESVYKVMDLLLSQDQKQELLVLYKDFKAGKKGELYTQIEIHDHNNKKRWILIRGRGVYNQKGELAFVHGIFLDTTKLKEQEEHISYLASYDNITGLPKRRTFMNKLKQEMHRMSSGAISLLDIDNFKTINDTLGHVYGDQLLKMIGERIASAVDSDTYVSRFGGDEFLILFLEVNSKEDIQEKINRILYEFQEPFELDYQKHYIKFSGGVAQFPGDSRDTSQLLMYVDTAMYHAKRTGKDKCLFYSENMQDDVKRRAKIVEILRESLDEDGFVLYYQPQVDAFSGEAVSYEALLRLKHHRLSPGEFIPIAEEVGLIKDMGRWVTEEAIKQIAKWKEKGLPLKPISINFSSGQIRDFDYVVFLKDKLEEYNVEAKYIEIEITESILLVKGEDTIDFLNQLKANGISLALDDFGTEYSSLRYLTFIPVDKIKLDKSLCDDFFESGKADVLDSLIGLAHTLGLVITAEGIEEECQYNYLRNSGCDYIQGYIFSKPLQVEELEKIYFKNFLEGLDKKEG